MSATTPEPAAPAPATTPEPAAPAPPAAGRYRVVGSLVNVTAADGRRVDAYKGEVVDLGEAEAARIFDHGTIEKVD